MINGPTRTRAELANDRRDVRQIKALGLFFSSKIDKKEQTGGTNARVFSNDKIASAEGSDYELAIKKLTYHTNKKRLE